MLHQNCYTPAEKWECFLFDIILCVMELDLKGARHSLAHVLAQAVQRSIDPTVQLGTGPAVDDGFYYDMLFSDGVSFGEDQLKPLQKIMEGIVKE